MTEKIFALLSGGIDSTTALAMAKAHHPEAEVECVTIDYGQRHKREILSAQQVAEHYGAEHVILDLRGLLTGMLVEKGDTAEGNDEIPNVDYSELPKGISPTYVSFRNGLMLSAIAARAQAWVMSEERKIDQLMNHPEDTDHKHSQAEIDALKAEVNAYIYCGVHADDAANWAYPDCTPEFIGGMVNAIFIGTYNKVRLKAPLLEMPKAMVVQIGQAVGAPLALTWSCYVGGEKHCGICPTCRSRKSAFVILNKQGVKIKDPTVYAA